jgi:hypothetical protein
LEFLHAIERLHANVDVLAKKQHYLSISCDLSVSLLFYSMISLYWRLASRFVVPIL